MIAGCIEKMRARDCGACDRRDTCAFIMPDRYGRLLQPAGEKPPERRGRSLLRMLFGEIARAARKEMARKEDGFRKRVEAELEHRLADGPPGIDIVARALGCSRQTLYRRLKAEGVTFASVLDDLRRRRALKLIRDPMLQVRTVGYDLGFSDPAAFSRAFKRWTGLSPRAFRERKGVQAG
ncbi:MAG TPA: helix-turn-helix domain-containing protein [Allosphingosinicella sp.]|nr:helix-turn-helix domain-containing protein [Allosphingosinicella sp.]